MGEIFQWEHPAKELPFTGERFTSETAGQIQIEHFHRYFLARDFSRNKDVLDIACGEGYGAALIAQVANFVTGIEIDADTVIHASQVYSRSNLRFIRADARAIPLAAASVDVVISFETIEHLHNQEVFIAEVRRVLRPSGIFVVSTPNRDVYSPSGSPANPYHTNEITIPTLEKMLEGKFEWVKCLLQRPMLGSAVLPAGEMAETGSALTFERRGDDHFEGSSDLPRAVYAVAVAAAQPVPLPTVSLYIETSGLDQRHDRLAELGALSARLEAEIAGLKLEQERLENLVRENRSTNERLELLFVTARDENQRLEALFATARSENERLEALFRTACDENQRLESLFAAAQSENRRLETLLSVARDDNQRLEGLLTDARSDEAEHRRLASLVEAVNSENQRLLALGVEARAQLTSSRERFEERIVLSDAALARTEAERNDALRRLEELALRLGKIETSRIWRALTTLRLLQRKGER